MIPRATPAAAPVIKPRMVTPVMDGVLPTSRKPAPAIHKVQRTIRMFMMPPTALPLSPLAPRCTASQGNLSIQETKYYCPPGQPRSTPGRSRILAQVRSAECVVGLRKTGKPYPQLPFNDWIPDEPAPRLPGSHEVR